MKSECLPFRQIPHTTRLFADFLSYDPKVRQFFPRPPHFSEWVKHEVTHISHDSARREQVAQVLDKQNRGWGASGKTLDNIARFRSGAAAVVTGQQVGLFGGPAFAIYKALTAALLADNATQDGVAAVPIFWLATEDHDLAEINHARIPGPQYALQVIKTPTEGVSDAPVGTIRFGNEIDQTVAAAGDLLGPEAADLLRESYRAGESFGSAFARLFTRLFADLGVIFLDSSDPRLHAISAPIFRSAIEHSADLDEALMSRGKALESSGYHQQVKVTSSSTLLFHVRDGARIVVHRRANGNGGEFVIGDEKIGRDELLQRVSDAPDQFSANVLLRPVVQDYLLPTLLYIGGPAEIAYFAQAGVVYEKLLGHVTPILPRFSATLLEPKVVQLLERYRLSFTDLFHGPEKLREELAARTLPGEIQHSFDLARSTVESSMQSLREALQNLDVTLVDAGIRAQSKMTYQIDRLQRRAARSELIRTEVLARHADILSNALYPEKTLQEREVAGIYFIGRYGRDILHQLYRAIHPDCLDHQLITLE